MNGEEAMEQTMTDAAMTTDPRRDEEMKSNEADSRKVYTKETASKGFFRLSQTLSRDDVAFIAVDCEFTGWGRHADLMNPDVQVRYSRLRELIVQRALVSIGVAVFLDRAVESPTESSYTSETMEFLLLCSDDFTISPDAGTFLVSHDFDFNAMFMRGIPYSRAATDPGYSAIWKKEQDLLEKKARERSKAPTPTTKRRKDKKRRKKAVAAKRALADRWDPLPRGLLRRFGLSGAPVVLHNGLLDLMFLYSSFEGPLPCTLQEFIHAVLHVTPCLYDTKFLAENLFDEPVTFLGYLHEKLSREKLFTVQEVESASEGDDQKWNKARKGRQVEIIDDPPICERFASRGFCPGGTMCAFSHDLSRILDRDEAHPLKSLSEEEVNARRKVEHRQKGVPPRTPLQSTDLMNSSSHSAGTDAFQTGLIFAGLLARAKASSKEGNETQNLGDGDDDDDEETGLAQSKALQPGANRISSFGKGPALLFARSEFQSDQTISQTEGETDAKL